MQNRRQGNASSYVASIGMTLVVAFFTYGGSAFAAMAVKVTPKPNPPDVGANQLQIQLSDEAGKVIEGAKIEMQIFMPAMGAMPRMDEKPTITDKGAGQYLAEYELSMGGTWELAATIEGNGMKNIFHASITTGIPEVAVKGNSNATSNPTQLLDLGPQRLQLIGVRFADAKVTSMTRDIEAIGIVEQDQTHREEVTLRVSGYVVKQFRGRVGDLVRQGDPLFSVYSPDLVTAQSEFFLAEGLASTGRSLHQAAAEKLKNLGLSEGDIKAIRKAGKPQRDFVVRAPISGTILDISAREGGAVNPGQVVYIIGDLSQSYIVARVFQQDVSDLKVGQTAHVSIPGSGADVVKGRIDLIYPQVETGAGTTNVRVEVAEFTKGLSPGVYVDLRFPVDLGQLLAIPAEAILYSGRHRYVFVDRGNGVLEPREVAVGKTSHGLTEVRDGLSAGERVAASGTFLLGSEAQLRSALPKWRQAEEQGVRP